MKKVRLSKAERWRLATREALFAAMPTRLLENHPQDVNSYIEGHLAKDSNAVDAAYERLLIHSSTPFKQGRYLPGTIHACVVERLSGLGIGIWDVNHNFLELESPRIFLRQGDGYTGLTILTPSTQSVFVSTNAGPHVLLHEAIHATGRHLGRWQVIPFNRHVSKEFIVEDIIAEIGEGLLLARSQGNRLDRDSATTIVMKKFDECLFKFHDMIENAYGSQLRFLDETNLADFASSALKATTFLAP